MAAAMAPAPAGAADKVVILHTNDTHSQIDPDRQKNRGGVLRRKALLDSIRQAEPNVLLVDAGDAVQGSLYYTLFGGEVEQRMLNRLGYDVQIIGNHEFDNGMEELADNYATANASILSANNLFDGTPLDGLFQPYVIKETGGHRIAFIGVNINPDGLISPVKSKGVVYKDAVEEVNRIAAKLRKEAEVDAVVVVSHIGYSGDNSTKGYTDVDLAALCPDVDVIIGGHSHTALTPADPRIWIRQADGDSMLVVQNGKGGQYVGAVELDFPKDGPMQKSWRRYAVDSRLDNRIDSVLACELAPYRQKVDSIYAVPITEATADFSNDAMRNFAADFVKIRGEKLSKGRRVDLAVMNKGGIRQNFVKGVLTRGNIIDVFPFDNRVVVLEVRGDSLLELFNTFAKQGGQGVSANVEALMNTSRTGVDWVTIDGADLDPRRTYRVATIDYLAEGGDDMSQFKSARTVATSDKVLYDDMIAWFTKRNKPISPDPTQRMK